MKEENKLEQRLKIVEKNIKLLIDFIDENRLFEKFDKSAQNTNSALSFINKIEMASRLSKSNELRLMIIENFIEYYTSNDKERQQIKECAYDYIAECHYNELEELEELI